MLDAMLCVSRFAHWVKLIGRHWLGSFNSADELEVHLHNWIGKFVGSESSNDASRERRAEFPLTDHAVRVVPVPGRPGAFKCQVHLRPRLTPNSLIASIRLTTELVSPDASASEI